MNIFNIPSGSYTEASIFFIILMIIIFLIVVIIGLTTEKIKQKEHIKYSVWEHNRYFNRLFKTADWEEVVEIAERK